MIDASKLYYNRYGKNSDLDLSQVDISPLLKSILSRASVRKFSKKPVTKEILMFLLMSARNRRNTGAVSAHLVFPIRFDISVLILVSCITKI